MKLLSDFLPVLLFFVAYKYYGIYPATAVAMAVSLVQVGYAWIRYRRVEPMNLLTLAIILLFGGATLIFHDEQFIKWKPTIINWMFGLAFLVSRWWGDKPLLERMLQGNLELPENVWRRLNYLWITFFLSVGAANLLVVYNYDTETWVNFKLFGMLGLTLAFVLGQSIYLYRYMPQPSAEE
ncbi:septation protein A [Methylogaea oryzae]|uniref:Inner membrane-spanning protein YciB n=1 Tax=Methylogaea oryzae TaxID=1295382 RepID=A0A8D4VN40_9GAMM|nr:septation protein A [Methylogaea oryzae]BBL71243.1 putative intracellular septation protein A [Methylogaea oryzae]